MNGRGRRRAALVAAALVVASMTPAAVGAAPEAPAAAALTGARATAPGPGHALSTTPAGRTSRVAGSRSARVLRYTTTSVRGRTVPATGLVLTPRKPPPRGGWPVVVYGHMTTGAADRCAPTRGTPGHDELRRMQQGDAVARRLLAAGVAVLRPDFEGLGVPGPHPYLRGRSLGTSMVDMVRAAREVEPRLGDRWLAAGHSEGAVAALNAAERSRGPIPGMRLTGVVAFTPVTQMEVLIQLLQGLPVAGPGVDTLVALAALILKGHSAEDPAFGRLLLQQGGLSPRARRLWPHLEQRCLEGLMRADSWGGLAPGQLLGERGREASRLLRRSLAAQDVRHLRFAAGLPVRIDMGLLDLVAPAPFTQRLVASYRGRGVDVTLGRWLADHSGVVGAKHAAGPAVEWMLARLHGR